MKTCDKSHRGESVLYTTPVKNGVLNGGWASTSKALSLIAATRAGSRAGSLWKKPERLDWRRSRPKTDLRGHSREQTPLNRAILFGSLLVSGPLAGGDTLIVNDLQEVTHPFQEATLLAWLGVNSGDRVKFYRYSLRRLRVENRPFDTLDLLETADEIIYSRNRLGVRTGRTLRFLDHTKAFRPMPKYEVELPEDTSELVLSGDRLGIRTGRILRHYNISANFRHMPKFDYTVPEGTDELVIGTNMTGNWLGVRIGTALSFYNIDRNYQPHPRYVYTLPPDTEEIALAGPWMLVKSGDTISFYDFTKKVMNKPRLVVTLMP